MSRFAITDPEWATQLEQDYEEYMAGCWNVVDAEFFEEETEAFETLSGEPFCGCNTCQTRETLFFYTPRLIEAYRSGKITYED